MNNRTTGMLYVVAGVCFAVSGAARFAAGKLPGALLQAGLVAAMMALAFKSFKKHRIREQEAQTGEIPAEDAGDVSPESGASEAFEEDNENSESDR